VSNALVQKSGNSRFAWIIAHETTQLWWGQGLAPGPAEDMHSGWAEAFGLLATLMFIQHYLSCYDPLPDVATMKCFCDNLGVITNILAFHANEISCPNNTTNDNCDLIPAINDVVTKCQPLVLQFLYVEGHQDSKYCRWLVLVPLTQMTLHTWHWFCLCLGQWFHLERPSNGILVVLENTAFILLTNECASALISNQLIDRSFMAVHASYRVWSNHTIL